MVYRNGEEQVTTTLDLDRASGYIHLAISRKTSTDNSHQSVCIFLTIVTSGLQYVVQWMNYKRDVGRIEWIMKEARTAAWGAKMIPIEGKRKVRTNLAMSESRATQLWLGKSKSGGQ
jgi:hypothetical protein